MGRWIAVLSICAVIGAGVAVSGLAGLLPLERMTPPPVPDAWAAGPLSESGRVEVALVTSSGLVSGIAAGLPDGSVAARTGGALALVDGRVFATHVGAARSLLQQLAWDGLEIHARQATLRELDEFAAPASPPLAWRARHLGYTNLRAVRDAASDHPAWAVGALVAAILLLLHTALTGPPRVGRITRQRPPWEETDDKPDPMPSRRQRRMQRPVRVVLVQDQAVLDQVRVAIGEEHVVAATEHAFAFADGWILAARKGSVFALMSELGWRMRPIEMARRSELADEGRTVLPQPRDGDDETLELLDALHVCGPLAHGRDPRMAAHA